MHPVAQVHKPQEEVTTRLYMFFYALGIFTLKYAIRSLIYADYGPVMGSGSS